MLNKNGERELCYSARITDIKPIEGSDNCECAYVGGWKAMVRKDTFKVGDLCVCFEYDSLLDNTNPVFAFMEKRKYRVKAQKYTFGGKGNFVSDALVMSIDDFGWTLTNGEIVTSDGKKFKENEGMSEYLKVIYYEPEDNRRKAPSVDKYKLMARRHPTVFKTKIVRWLMRRTWGKKLLFIFFGKKKDKKNGWPRFIEKTDEERIQNCPYLLTEDIKWYPTEKIDGTSTTFGMINKRKKELIVCSRNVRFDTDVNKKCYYDDTDGNVYLEMAKKYDMYTVLKTILAEHKNWKNITIQGETYGGTIQKRKYGNEHKLAIFNVIYYNDAGEKYRLNPIEMKKFTDDLNTRYGFTLECVPILSEEGIELPKTSDEVLDMAHGESKIDGELREGIVFRSEDGVKSFKAVDNLFLVKYHS